MIRFSLNTLLVLLCIVTLATQPATAVRPPIREAPRVLNGSEHGVGRKIPDLAFKDLKGQLSSLSRLGEEKPVVILITGTGCPLCKRYAPSLASLEKDYTEKGVHFLFVNPNKAEKTAKITKAVETHGFKGPYVRDTDHSIIRSLRAKTTTEAFVLDSSRTLVYRGAVDDQYGFGYALNAPRKTYLRDALDAVLAGQLPTVTATSSPGCELWIDDEEPVATETPAAN
jgi:thiol-disulfide isomerase/thioredoxin